MVDASFYYLSLPLTSDLNVHWLCCRYLSLQDRWCESARLCKALLPPPSPPAHLRPTPQELQERSITAVHLTELLTDPNLFDHLLRSSQSSPAYDGSPGDDMADEDEDGDIAVMTVPMVIPPESRGTVEHRLLCRLAYYTRVSGYRLVFDEEFYEAVTALPETFHERLFTLLAFLPIVAVTVHPHILIDDDGEPMDEDMQIETFQLYQRFLTARSDERGLSRVKSLAILGEGEWMTHLVEDFIGNESCSLHQLRALTLQLHGDINYTGDRPLDDVDDLFDCAPSLETVSLSGLHLGSVSFLYMLKQKWRQLDLDWCLVTESVCDAFRTEHFVDDGVPQEVVVEYRSHWSARPEHLVPSVIYPLIDVTRGRTIAELFVQLFPQQNPRLYHLSQDTIALYRPL